MDRERFQEIIRSLATSPSRRTVGQALVGLSAGSFLAPLLDFADAAARKKRKHKKKKKCKSGTKKCSKRCIPRSNCCTTADCDDNESCQDGSCAPSCEPRCAGKACGDNGCGGSCGECGGNETCQSGTCTPPPPTCSDSIRNGDETDVDCGGSCPESCANGQTCAGDGDCGSGHCVSLVCRECAITADCPIGRLCEGGVCCTGEGFETENACTEDAQCCSGNCATHAFGQTCRPAGCLPTGGDCTAASTVCCSFTCSANMCQ